MMDKLQRILRGKVAVYSTVYPDTWKRYNGLKEMFEEYKTIDYGASEYTRDNVMTTGIESYWVFAGEIKKHYGVVSEYF